MTNEKTNETKLVETAVKSAAKDKSQRLYQMEAKLSVLLNEVETMHKAINKCALASTERMMLLYPLFRLYADESDTYI